MEGTIDQPKWKNNVIEEKGEESVHHVKDPKYDLFI